jgi:hypothetical protein
MHVQIHHQYLVLTHMHVQIHCPYYFDSRLLSNLALNSFTHCGDWCKEEANDLIRLILFSEKAIWSKYYALDKNDLQSTILLHELLGCCDSCLICTVHCRWILSMCCFACKIQRASTLAKRSSIVGRCEGRNVRIGTKREGITVPTRDVMCNQTWNRTKQTSEHCKCTCNDFIIAL